MQRQSRYGVRPLQAPFLSLPAVRSSAPRPLSMTRASGATAALAVTPVSVTGVTVKARARSPPHSGACNISSASIPPGGGSISSTALRAPSVASSATLLAALLTACEVAAANSRSSALALASLTLDLVARNSESVQLALVQVASVRSALLARKSRVLGFVNRFSRKQGKRLVASFEAVGITTKQLRLWAAVACSDAVCALDYKFVASPLLTSPCESQLCFVDAGLRGSPFAGELGFVAIGDGLHVVSAAGPGLKWFEPHSRNEFSVVLAQADGSVPLWLVAGDVIVDVLGFCCEISASARGVVSAVYRDLSDNATDVNTIRLQLTVCGVGLAGAGGDGDWGVRVHRRPLAASKCTALGTHLRSLALGLGKHVYGMAVTPDEKWLVVSSADACTLSVFSLPGGALVRTFGGRGVGPLQFWGPVRLCFAPNGHIVVVEGGNKRLQEVTLEGGFVRLIGGTRKFGDGNPYCVAVHDGVIAVGCIEGTGPRVVLFDFGTGAGRLRFGKVGTAPGQLSAFCTGIRFATDAAVLVVAESGAKRLSVFTTAGAFVSCVGVGVLDGGSMDVVQSAAGEYVVADCNHHRVCVFAPGGVGSGLVRSWGGDYRVDDGQFQYPSVLVAAGRHVYVMGYGGGRVHVFE